MLELKYILLKHMETLKRNLRMREKNIFKKLKINIYNQYY